MDPQGRYVFKLHAAAMALLGLHMGALAIVPVLLRKTLAAGEWQTTAATMAIPSMAILTIVWNEIYARIRPSTFLVGLWLTSHVPLAGLGLCSNAGTALAFYVTSTVTFGAAGLFHADVLRRCYPAGIRNRLFGQLNAISLLAAMGSACLFGEVLDHDPQAFRFYMPVTIACTGLGTWLLTRVAAHPAFRERFVARPTNLLKTHLNHVLHHMVRVLRDDPQFRRCEAAFFIYGLGYMSCTAILPFLTCDKLDLKYTEFAVSTQVAYNLVMLATMVPAGWLMDRFGPIRVTAWSFLMVTLYPVGLMFVNGEATLTLVVIYNALAMAGIQLAGTLAPITLARAAADAPTYVGIHLTLVGPRAILGNLAAVALYNRTDRIELPLALAAILFIGGAIMMFRLRLRPTSPAGLPSRSPGETARTSADAIP